LKEIINVSTDVLKVHPRNTEFFDDISGEEYIRFKKSIQEDGILSPILVSPDMTVISGHQRLKACKDLGIKLVPIMIREDLTDENDKLKVLLVANFGRNKNDETKQRKVAVEYVNLCGLKNGEKLCDNRTALSLDEIATQLGTNKRSLQELLEIERKLTPEIKELIDSGTITKTTASKILTKLTLEEQEELIKSLDITKKLTQTQVQEYVNKVTELTNKNAGYELKLQKIKELEDEIEILNEELTNRPSMTVEVKPSDYDSTKISLEGYKKDYTGLKTQYDSKIKEITTLKEQIESMKSITEEEQYTKKLKDGAIFFCARVNDFIEKTGGFVWLSDHITELPEYERKSYIKAIEMVENWAIAMKMNMKQYLD